MFLESENDMKVAAIDEFADSIPARLMENGQIGIVSKWPYRDSIGRLVIAMDDRLWSLTHGDAGNSWTSRTTLGDECRVRILKPGTTLTITE